MSATTAVPPILSLVIFFTRLCRVSFEFHVQLSEISMN